MQSGNAKQLSWHAAYPTRWRHSPGRSLTLPAHPPIDLCSRPRSGSS